MTTPVVPISWGELLDKITILEIKSQHLRDERALMNVRNELRQLNEIAGGIAFHHEKVSELKASLKQTNERLWKIEDDIRACESAKDFGERFVELARAVYISNDERGRIKREINLLLKSALIEEKQYRRY